MHKAKFYKTELDPTMRNLQYSIAAVVLLFACVITTRAQTTDEIVKKHLAAIGGVANWKKVNSIITKGILLADNSEYAYTNTILNGKGERKEFSANGKTAYEIVTDKNGWAYVPQIGLKADPEPMAEVMLKKFQYDLDIQGPLIDYKAKGNKLSYLGKEDMDGTVCYKLEVDFPGGRNEIMYFDTASYYHIGSKVMVKELGTVVEEHSATYGHFKKLPEGIVVPMTFNIGDGPVKLDAVEINKPVKENIFNPNYREIQVEKF